MRKCRQGTRCRRRKTGIPIPGLQTRRDESGRRSCSRKGSSLVRKDVRNRETKDPASAGKAEAETTIIKSISSNQGAIMDKDTNQTNKKEKKPGNHVIRNRVFMVITSILLVAVIIGNVVLTNYADSIDAFIGTPEVQVTEEEMEVNLEEASALSLEIEAEGTVLLQNNDDTLPLSSDITKVNVFGWASTAWLGGGSGSGMVTHIDVDFLQALEDYGIEYNTELTDMYEDFQDDRDYTGTLGSYPEQSAQLYEPSISDTDYYTESMLENALAYSDTAIVVIGRLAGGESNDVPTEQYKITTKNGDVVVDETRTTLNFSTEELELLTYCGENYENVIVILNTTNTMAVGEIETIPGVDACLLVGLTGSEGASVLPAILWGEEEPSGRLADTWAYDLATAASYANSGMQGVGAYTDADGLYPADGTTNGNLGTSVEYTQVSYVDYAEGIYIGYKWYETADTEGYWDDVDNEYGSGYDGVVQYPFGYGLSYTTFEWEVTDYSADGTELEKDGEVSITVKVTNTGDVAGKDVVQLYYTTPYYTGEIEKSSVELGAYAKTDTLEPGESQELTLTVTVEDMASYDDYDANGNGFAGYELDEGEYIFSIRHNAHDVDDDDHAEITCTLSENVQYPTDSTTGAEVSNKFTGEDAVDGVSLDGSDSGQNITYLTRADFEGTFPTENVDSRAMSETVAALNLYTDEMAEEWIDEDDEPITTGASNGLVIEDSNGTTDTGYQLGEDYDDPLWDDLLDQLTIDEMEYMYINGYGATVELESIGKLQGTDTDGPAQVGSWGRPAGDTVAFPNSTTVAQTWNTELALEEGHYQGKIALQNGYSGLYAPATNMHRSPLDGRNYEYYSEDSYLSGTMCGNVVQGIQEMGVYCYVKHLVCNDGESGIYRDSVYTWMTEQTLRETYLEPFRMLVEDYDAQGIMSSYNRIGAVWAGGSEALLTSVLREEWGFEGAVITDYADHHAYMNGDQALRAGGSLWMAGFGSGEMQFETSSNSYYQRLREAAHEVLYMYLHVRVINRDYSESIGDDSVLRPVFKAAFANWRYLVVAIDVLAVVLFALALINLLRARKKDTIRVEKK